MIDVTLCFNSAVFIILLHDYIRDLCMIIVFLYFFQCYGPYFALLLCAMKGNLELVGLLFSELIIDALFDI